MLEQPFLDFSRLIVKKVDFRFSCILGYFEKSRYGLQNLKFVFKMHTAKHAFLLPTRVFSVWKCFMFLGLGKKNYASCGTLSRQNEAFLAENCQIFVIFSGFSSFSLKTVRYRIQLRVWNRKSMFFFWTWSNSKLGSIRSVVARNGKSVWKKSFFFS